MSCTSIPWPKQRQNMYHMISHSRNIMNSQYGNQITHFLLKHITRTKTFIDLATPSSSESNKCKIFKLQKRACKVILDYNVYNSTEAMQSLKIMSIYDRLYLRKAKGVLAIRRIFSLVDMITKPKF